MNNYKYVKYVFSYILSYSEKTHLLKVTTPDVIVS